MAMNVHPATLERELRQPEAAPGSYPEAAPRRAFTICRSVGRYLLKQCLRLGAIGLAVLLIGEVWARLPSTPRGIQYAYDEELGHRYLPNQIASSRTLGLFAVDTPSMLIDEYGFRNPATDWSRPVILALGSSEVVGPGVADDEIWTARLSALLNESGERVVVYNAGTAAYGPYHELVVLRRFVARHTKPALVLVRVSVADREFLPFTPEQLQRERISKERRDTLKRYTQFVPFLLAKAQLQLNSVSTQLAGLRAGHTTTEEADKTAEQAASMWAQNKSYWQEMAQLGNELHIPVLFVVFDPYGTEGGTYLFHALSSEFERAPCAAVWMLDAGPFGLTQPDRRDREKLFAERYTLGYDPHANALQHRIIADELLAQVKGVGTLPGQFPSCRS